MSAGPTLKDMARMLPGTGKCLLVPPQACLVRLWAGVGASIALWSPVRRSRSWGWPAGYGPAARGVPAVHQVHGERDNGEHGHADDGAATIAMMLRPGRRPAAGLETGLPVPNDWAARQRCDLPAIAGARVAASQERDRQECHWLGVVFGVSAGERNGYRS